MDISEIMPDFVFGFKYQSEPVDMIDNQYININFMYQNKIHDNVIENESIGVQDCTSVSHLNKIYSKETIKHKFGNLYCSKTLKSH